MIVVIPSNRSINLEYLSPLIDAGARFIIVDDSEGNIRVDHPQFEVYNWGDRKKMLGALDHAIPKRNGACRDFGFYVAYKESDDNEIIIALDDDCEIYSQDFAQQVEQILSDAPRPYMADSARHLNIVDLYQDMPDNLFPRGFPYTDRVSYKPSPLTPTKAVEGEVKFSLGLWKNIFDVNAIDKIQGPQYIHPDAELIEPSVIIPKGGLISVCSMNMHCRREVLPAVYQLPMHVQTMPNWVIDRYGDIWGGFLLKVLMDKKGDPMAAGGPMIRHLKEGNYQRNIWQEHQCHMVNDEFIDILTRSVDAIDPNNYVQMLGDLNEHMAQNSQNASVMLKPYMEHLNKALDAWVNALS